ncbi:MAG: BON domain-containing protein [Burkholderiaceae bacterium]
MACIGTTVLPACAPLVVGGAMVGGTLVFMDRRTTGAQVDDQAIELKAGNRIKEIGGPYAHVNITSYNRTVLLTGEVATEADRGAVEQTVQRIDNVRSTVNELAAMAPSSLGARSQDTVLTSKIKATLVDARDLQANAFKVVTERSVVYLMGRVTEREANRATELARGVSGVQKVVRVFEIVTEAELAESAPKK